MGVIFVAEIMRFPKEQCSRIPRLHTLLIPDHANAGEVAIPSQLRYHYCSDFTTATK